MENNPSLVSGFSKIIKRRSLGMVFAIAKASSSHLMFSWPFFLNFNDFKRG